MEIFGLEKLSFSLETVLSSDEVSVCAITSFSDLSADRISEEDSVLTALLPQPPKARTSTRNIAKNLKNLICITYFATLLFQTVGEKRSNIGKISSRPKSIPKERAMVEKSLYTE